MAYYKVPEVKTYTVSRATGTLPQTTQSAIFTVSGRVYITKIIGEVTTQIGAGANNCKLIANPTVGADVDICAQLDIDADVVGTVYNITGTLADAMVATTSGAAIGQAAPVFVADGTIDLYCDASKTGSVSWVVQFQPLDYGSTVVVA